MNEPKWPVKPDITQHNDNFYYGFELGQRTMHDAFMKVIEAQKESPCKCGLVSLDENTFFELLKGYHGGNTEYWLKNLQTLWDNHFSKFASPSPKVMSIEDIYIELSLECRKKGMENLLNSREKENELWRYAATIHLKLTGEKK